MATHETEERNGKLRTVMKLEPGERVALCRCMRSKDFPFCDGTHKRSKETQTCDCGSAGGICGHRQRTVRRTHGAIAHMPSAINSIFASHSCIGSSKLYAVSLDARA